NGDATTSETTSDQNAKYKLTPVGESPQYPDAKINSMTYLQGKFTFELSGDSYRLGVQTADAGQKMCANSAEGQHIHVIIDNEPYHARYTSTFSDVPMEDGSHYVLGFLSRSYHESIKTKDAFKASSMFVTDGSALEFESINEPMLFYSRPKGVYVGEKDTKK